MDFIYYDFNTRTKSKKIDFLFEDWRGEEETVVIYSPHDDDGILGPGYILSAARENGAECFVFIFCNGSGGYSHPGQKDDIVEIRKKETVNSYMKLGIDRDHIIRFDYSDFTANTRVGWKLVNGEKGSLEKAIRTLREIRATRVLIPNGYREHLDHEAVAVMGKYDGPQAGDPILADWGRPTKIKTVMEYAVWSDFSPQDALVVNRNIDIRANSGLRAEAEVEEQIREAIKEYRSQAQIINNLVQQREKRKIDENGYIEVYRKFDPRPELQYDPYIELVKKI